MRTARAGDGCTYELAISARTRRKFGEQQALGADWAGRAVPVVVGQKSVTQKKFPQPPRRSSGASAATLALGR
eukprot:COSAG02_NODE_24249_length_693_cov_4.166667_2_plen_72_part_01